MARFHSVLPRLAVAPVAVLLLLLLVDALPPATQGMRRTQPCPSDSQPAAGCHRGLWSAALCECQCIPPFCRDPLDGRCLSAGHCDAKKNPWENCTDGADCPWWNDRLNEEEATCVTGVEVPPGVWEVHASEEDCRHSAVHRLHSSSFRDLQEEESEVITIRFTVSGLPSGEQVNMRELKDEMALVLRRVLAIVADMDEDLKVTAIKEDILTNDASRDATYDGRDDKREVYYDISVLRHPKKQFGPVVVAVLRDSYGELVEYLEHYETSKYFGYGTDFYLCIRDDGDEGGGETLEAAGVCSFTEKTVDAGRLTDLPMELDVDMLANQMTAIYKDLLKGIDRLDIIDVEKEVVNVTSVGGGSRKTDMFFDIRFMQKYGLDDFFGPAIREKLRGSTDDILSRIQDYTDAQTNLALHWHVTETGIYTVGPTSEPFPTWAIITCAVAGAVMLCGCFYCVVRCIRRQADRENRVNMVNYLQTRHNHLDEQKVGQGGHGNRGERKVGRHPHHRSERRLVQTQRTDMRHPPSSRRREVPREVSRRDQRRGHAEDYDRQMRPKNHRGMANARTHNIASRDEMPARKDTEYQLTNAKSFVFDHRGETGGHGHDRPPPEPLYLEDSPTRGGDRRRPAPQTRQNPAVPRKDTEYELKNMETFIFDHDGSGGYNDPSGPCMVPADEDGEERVGDREYYGSQTAPDPDGVRASMVVSKKTGRFDGEESGRQLRKNASHEP